MAQTKKMSFVEAVTNTLIGFLVSLISTPIVFSACGLKYSGGQLWGVTALMTVVSIVRGYVIRRWFNKKD